MGRIEFGLSGGLSPREVETIHETVLKILADTGVACGHAPTVEVVTSEPGVGFDGGRLRFSTDVVEEAIAAARKAGKKRKPRDRVKVTAPWTCFNMTDMDSNAVRASTAKDAVAMLKLAASFNDDGPPPVYPCDLDPRLQVVWLEKACLEHTPGFGGAMVSHEPEAIRAIGDLYAAVGRRYTLSMQFVISPLRLDHLALELFWQFRDDPAIDVWASICPIPVGGLTAPLFPSGLLAQTIAESLSGIIVARRLGLAGPDTVLPVRADYGDMRDMTIGYSLPENVMLQVLLRDLSEHFAGYRLDALYLNTNAKQPDAFAAADRMAYMLMLGLAGFREFFMGAGQLSMDEIFSPAQFIIDMEMGRYVQRILDGLSWEGEAESIATTVAEGVSEGTFMAHQTTLDALPSLFDSLLFRRSNVGQWRAAGEPTVEQLARARAREAIEAYQYELEAAQQAELDRSFESACRRLGMDAASQPIPQR